MRKKKTQQNAYEDLHTKAVLPPKAFSAVRIALVVHPAFKITL